MIKEEERKEVVVVVVVGLVVRCLFLSEFEVHILSTGAGRGNDNAGGKGGTVSR